MTLPVSSYEELLAHVRSLTSETIQLRQEISMSLCGPSNSDVSHLTSEDNEISPRNYATFPQKRALTNIDQVS